MYVRPRQFSIILVFQKRFDINSNLIVFQCGVYLMSFIFGVLINNKLLIVTEIYVIYHSKNTSRNVYFLYKLS